MVACRDGNDKAHFRNLIQSCPSLIKVVGVRALMPWQHAWDLQVGLLFSLFCQIPNIYARAPFHQIHNEVTLLVWACRHVQQVKLLANKKAASNGNLRQADV